METNQIKTVGISAKVQKHWYENVKGFIKKHNDQYPANKISLTSLIYCGINHEMGKNVETET